MDAMELLRARFPSNAYAVLEEVRDAAGFYAGRSGDCLVMSLWPSRGLTLQGFEIKASRSDWLRELKNPEKAESLWGYCDRWWLLTEDEKAAQFAEIPETWGWMSVKGTRLKVLRDAPKLDPKPLTRSFLAALLKRAVGTAPAVTELKKEHAAGYKEGEDHAKRLAGHDADKLKNLLEQIRLFENASGLAIEHGWEMAKIGTAVMKYLRDGIPGEVVLRRYREQLVRSTKELDGILGDIAQPVVD